MEEIIKECASLGMMGIVGGLLFTTFLQERKDAGDETKNTIEYLKNEITHGRNLYKEELEKDRAVYVNSISKITDSISQMTSRIDSIENDVKDIKNKLDQ